MSGDPATKCLRGVLLDTGILYKGTVNHADGLLTELPLLDCVADMQVIFGWIQMAMVTLTGLLLLLLFLHLMIYPV